MPVTAYPPGEIVRIGKELYEREVRPKVETDENVGKILVLDIESGEYVVDDDHVTAMRRAHAQHPDGAFYHLRIGYPALGRMGGSWGDMRR
jgi:hypothetical protein